MLITPNRANLNKIVVLNPKGGCGKTTLVTNIASALAADGSMPAVMDCDPQGSLMRWLEKRPANLPPIYGIAAYKRTMQATRSWQLRIPQETRTVILDSPAGLSHDDLRDITRDACSILVPVLPSAIDIHAASRCIADLLLVAKIDRHDNKLAVIANRTRKNTRSYTGLMRFLDSLGIPVIGVLRDSQGFVQAAENGVGVGEMRSARARPDVQQIERIADWLRSWRNRSRNDTLTRSIRQAPNVTELRKRYSDSA